MLNARQSHTAWLYLLPALTLLALIGLVPIGFVAFYSVHDTFGGNVFIWVGTDWYQQVLGSANFYYAIARSLGFATLVLMIQIPLGVYLALRMPRSGVLATLYIVLMAIPMLTPTIVVGYLWKALIQPGSGLLYQSLAGIGVTLDMNHPAVTWALLLLMDTWHWTGLVVLLCYARLRTVPAAYYQAAAIDGASQWGVFRYIQLPRLQLVLAIAILLRFMDSFTLYTEPYVITRGGPGVSTTFLSHELVQTGLIQFDLGKAGAMAVIYFLIVMLVSAFFYRLIVPPTRPAIAPEPAHTSATRSLTTPLKPGQP
jgi:glycerol transport system permease protein